MVVHFETAVVLDRIKSVYVASGEVRITMAIYRNQPIGVVRSDVHQHRPPVKPAFRSTFGGSGLDRRALLVS